VLRDHSKQLGKVEALREGVAILFKDLEIERAMKKNLIAIAEIVCLVKDVKKTVDY